jgi:uncharacterized protein
VNSCLYECEVMHHRLEPKVHRFSYRIFLCAFDLDEIDALAAKLPPFSRNRPNLYSFRDRDHVTLPGLERATVRENLAAYLLEHGVALPAAGRVVLLTLPRILGYVFNPVSFYFCFDAGGLPLCAVAEVNNTFGEQKLFLLDGPCEGGVFRRAAPKRFYISPFSGLELAMDMRLRVPGGHLEIHIDDRTEEGPGKRRMLLTALTGVRRPLTAGRLFAYLLKYPLLTVRIIFLIHWNALLLWRKRVPWHRKAANPHLQREVLKPHFSIVEKSQ